jgi:DNA phosphorothioation-dependent restriction protein DptG
MWPSDYFLETFVEEHNLIDPQPGHKNEKGDPHFDDHMAAAKYVIECAKDKHIAHPLIVHQMLMRRLQGFAHTAGTYRKCNVQVGGRICPDWHDVPDRMREWQLSVEYVREQLNKPEKERREWVWNRHVDYEHIHPFEDGNGRSGRLLMMNHALLLNLHPWYVKYSERFAYYDRF